jgi:WD40 repeat protein
MYIYTHTHTFTYVCVYIGYALQGHSSGVQAVAVLKDRFLVSASDDYSLIVWDFGVGAS